MLAASGGRERHCEVLGLIFRVEIGITGRNSCVAGSICALSDLKFPRNSGRAVTKMMDSQSGHPKVPDVAFVSKVAGKLMPAPRTDAKGSSHRSIVLCGVTPVSRLLSLRMADERDGTGNGFHQAASAAITRYKMIRIRIPRTDQAIVRIQLVATRDRQALVENSALSEL